MLESEREAARQEIERCGARVVNRRGSLPAMVTVMMMTAAGDSRRGLERIRGLWRDHEGRFWRRRRVGGRKRNDCWVLTGCDE